MFKVIFDETEKAAHLMITPNQDGLEWDFYGQVEKDLIKVLSQKWECAYYSIPGECGDDCYILSGEGIADEYRDLGTPFQFVWDELEQTLLAVKQGGGVIPARLDQAECFVWSWPDPDVFCRGHRCGCGGERWEALSKEAIMKRPNGSLGVSTYSAANGARSKHD